MSFDTKAYLRKALSLTAPMVLLGCSTMPLGAGSALAQSDTSPQKQVSQSDEASQLMYELLIAELAGRRGQLDVAMAGYLSASERTDDPRVSERATRLALFGRHWQQAEKAVRRWIVLDPNNAEAPQLLGQTLLSQDKIGAAADLYVDIMSSTDDRSELLRAIQVELQRLNKPTASVTVMRRLVDAYSEEAEAQLGLARAYITAAKTPDALEATESALAVSPDNANGLLLRAQILASTGNVDEAFSSLRKALQRKPENTALRLGYTQLLVDGRRYAEVREELEMIHADSAEDPEKLLAISLLAIESGHLEQASIYLSDLRTSGAYKDQASFYLARISDDRKEYDQAIIYYDEVVEGELYFNAQVRAAELTALKGSLEQSRLRLQQLAARVQNPLLQTRLVAAESRILQNAEQNEEAVLVLTEGLQRFPDDSDLLYARALAADSVGNAQAMIDDLERLIELDADNAHALNALGYHYADKNIELERAEQLLVKANALLPDDPAIMDSLGWLRFRQGNYAEAITLLRAAYGLFPDPEIAAHLGAALWLSGAEQEAQALIDEALESNPEDKRLKAVKANTFK